MTLISQYLIVKMAYILYSLITDHNLKIHGHFGEVTNAKGI